MITRYSRPDAVAIWSQETKYKIWFEIEAHAATKMAELGVIPKESAEAIWAKGKDATFDADRIDDWFATLRAGARFLACAQALLQFDPARK